MLNTTDSDGVRLVELAHGKVNALDLELLLALIERLKRKPTPLFFLDTHAGRGAYDLQSADSARSSEWLNGIGRLRGANPESADLRTYLQAAGISGTRPTDRLQHYPGSPLLALLALRDNDRSAFVEQQPMEARALEKELPRRRNAGLRESLLARPSVDRSAGGPGPVAPHARPPRTRETAETDSPVC